MSDFAIRFSLVVIMAQICVMIWVPIYPGHSVTRLISCCVGSLVPRRKGKFALGESERLKRASAWREGALEESERLERERALGESERLERASAWRERALGESERLERESA